MYTAAENGDISLLKYHLSKGADPNYQHPEVMATPLFASIKNGHEQAVSLLLDYGADPNIKTELEGMDAYDAALHYGQNKLFDKLMQQKSAKNKSTNT